MPTEPASQKVLSLRVFCSFLGFVMGIAAFCLWMVPLLKNEKAYSVAAYGGLSGVLSLWHGILHAMHYQDLWRTWLRGLKWFSYFGLVFLVVSLASAIGFLAAAVALHEAFAVNSYYVTAIWCVVCSIYSAVLFWYARNYRNEFADLAAILEF